jgi:hypothetical protein
LAADGRGEAFRAHVIAYADDFVILSRGCAAEALAWTKAVMTRHGLTLNDELTLNETKTSLKMLGKNASTSSATPRRGRNEKPDLYAAATCTKVRP